MRDPSLRGRVLWYELLTTDVAAAEDFYGAVVGWTVAPFRTGPEAYDMWMRGPDEPVGGVMRIPEGMGFPPHWEMYVGVPRLDESVADVERLGGSAMSPTIDVPDIGRMRTMRDPQGAVFALYEPNAPPPPPQGEPGLGEVAWHELTTSDAEAALEFYTTLFGWRPTEAIDLGPMGKYHMFGRDSGRALGAMMNMPRGMEDAPPSWGLYFHVADVDTARTAVAEGGGKVLNGPMEVPGGGRIVNCLDPQGAAFSLHDRR